MSGCKGFGKHRNSRKGCGKAGECGKPFPPPGGFYVQWNVTPVDGKYERFSNSKKY